MENLLSGELVINDIAGAFYIEIRDNSTHRCRPSNALVYIIGDAQIEYDFYGHKIFVQNGDVIYLPKNSNYTIRKNSENNGQQAFAYAVNFNLTNEKTFAPFKVKTIKKKQLINIFEGLVLNWSIKDTAYYEKCFEYVYRIIYELKTIEKTKYYSTKEENFIKPAIEYISKNYLVEKITVEQLAALCKVSDSYFRRIFKLVFGISPKKYIHNLRLEYSKELLAGGGISVTEAAICSGFNDSAYFSREFKKYYGVSPVNTLRNKI